MAETQISVMTIREITDFTSTSLPREIMAEYMQSLPFDISYQSPQAELDDPGAAYSETNGGALFVAMEHTAIAGCVAVKKLSAENCEMKRLYVRHAYRGKELGRKLAE